MFRSPLQPMWDLTVHPFQDPTSSLAHRPVSGSDTIHNSPSPPLANIVLFGLPLKVFKTRLLGRGFHTLIKNASFPFSTEVGSHITKGQNSTRIVFEVDRKRKKKLAFVSFCSIKLRGKKNLDLYIAKHKHSPFSFTYHNCIYG